MGTPLPNLPELDINNGLKRVCGNEQLYGKLLVELFRQCESVIQQTRTALDNGEIEVATRLVHSVKGSAGNLGARNLAVTSEEFESALKQNEVTPDLWEKFEFSINVILFGLQEFINAQNNKNVPIIINNTENSSEIVEMIASLDRFVEKNMVLQCREIMKKIHTRGIPSYLHSSFIRINTFIEEYKFDEAKKEINRIHLIIARS